MTASSSTLQKSAIFFFMSLEQVAVDAAEQDVGRDADRAQLPHGVLGRLGLELAGGGDVGHQRRGGR